MNLGLGVTASAACRHWGIKTVDPCFHFLQAGSQSPTQCNYITFALIAQTKLTLYISLFNMVQIKLSVAIIVVAAAVIAHAVALLADVNNNLESVFIIHY